MRCTSSTCAERAQRGLGGAARWSAASTTTGGWSTASATRLWFVTNKDAPRYRLVAIDLGQAEPQLARSRCRRREETARRRDDRRQPAGRCPTCKDATSLARWCSISPASRCATIALNGHRHARPGFDGKPGDPETFYSFTSFNQPADDLPARSGDRRDQPPFAEPKLAFDPDDYRRRAALLRLEGRHPRADVHRAQARRSPPPARRCRRCSTAMAASTFR